MLGSIFALCCLLLSPAVSQGTISVIVSNAEGLRFKHLASVNWQSGHSSAGMAIGLDLTRKYQVCFYFLSLKFLPKI
jgi:hypothetical protein